MDEVRVGLKICNSYKLKTKINLLNPSIRLYIYTNVRHKYILRHFLFLTQFPPPHPHSTTLKNTLTSELYRGDKKYFFFK